MATSAPRVSSASTATVEEIGKATAGPKWFQMYLNVDQGISRELLQRVKPAGFKAVILTIDAIGQGSSDGPPGSVPALAPLRQLHGRQRQRFKTYLSWNDLEFTATTSGLPVVAKGITRPEDAVAAVKGDAAAV
jgi:lactate oxidase